VPAFLNGRTIGFEELPWKDFFRPIVHFPPAHDFQEHPERA